MDHGCTGLCSIACSTASEHPAAVGGLGRRGQGVPGEWQEVEQRSHPRYFCGADLSMALDPNELKIIMVRVPGGEIPPVPALAPKVGPFKLVSRPSPAPAALLAGLRPF